MGDIRQKITSDTSQYQRDMVKMQKQVNKLREELVRVKNEAKDGSNSQSDGVSRVNKALARQAAKYAGIGTAIQFVRAEVENLIAAQDKAGAKQVDVAKAQLNLLRNTASLTKVEQQKIDTAFLTLSKQNAVDPASIAAALSDSISAKGSAGVEAAIGAVGLASKVAFEDTETLRQTSGGILASGRMLGSTDARTNLGFLLSIAANTRVTDIGATAENLVPAVSSITKFGDSPVEAAALVNALTFASEDATGQKAGTAAVNLSKQLEKFAPQFEDTTARIGFLQKTPGARQAFLEAGSFEAKFLKPIEQLTTAGTDMAKLFEKQQRDIPNPERSAGLVDQLIQRIANDPLQQTFRFQREQGVATATLQLQNVEGGRAGIAGQGAADIVQAGGGSYAGQKVAQGSVFALTELGMNARQAETLAIESSPHVEGLSAGVAAQAAGGAVGGALEEAFGLLTRQSQEQTETLKDIAADLRRRPEIPVGDGNGEGVP